MLYGVSFSFPRSANRAVNLLQRWTWWNGKLRCLNKGTLFQQAVFRIIREATAKSKDGRIDESDFLNYSAANSRYSLFTPMEASMIFHFAGGGSGAKRLALIDFAQL